jgi:hypothetical protein
MSRRAREANPRRGIDYFNRAHPLHRLKVTVATLFLISGYQAILFAIHAKSFAISERLLPPSGYILLMREGVTLERGLLAGAVTMAAGVALLLGAVLQWYARGFGTLDYATTMRVAIPGVTLTTLGFQPSSGASF